MPLDANTKGDPKKFQLAMQFGILFGAKEKSSEVHKNLAVCLTIRQNELRLGRQRISSLEKNIFNLLTSPVDPLTEVDVGCRTPDVGGKAKNEMIGDRGEWTRVTDT